MTKAEKIEKILLAHESDKDDINRMYNYFFNIAPMTDDGEIDEDFILMLNQWQNKKLNDLQRHLASELEHI